MARNFVCWMGTVENIARTTGPGVYILFMGGTDDDNIVYVGRSIRDCANRVRAHRGRKVFEHVGLILPCDSSHEVIKTVEALILHEFVNAFGHLPRDNRRVEYFERVEHFFGGQLYDWTRIVQLRQNANSGEVLPLQPSR